MNFDNKAYKWVGEHQLGYDIWNKKYRYENESFDNWLERISAGNKAVKKLIEDKKFLFGGRILANRGLDLKGVKSTLSNCYVLSVDDSIESIYQCCSDIARTYSYGGGVGIDISKLRPKGAKVNNSAKETTGAVSFMKTFDTVTGTIGQNGRRGALMISININHPDVEEFINIKANTDQITNANISVRVNNDFMSAVEHDEDYILRWPCNEHVIYGQDELEYNQLYYKHNMYIKKIKARELFNKLVYNNWNYAEPGILYWDQIDNWNLMQLNEDFQYAGVNPCAEEPLTNGSACLLGAMNISQYVYDEEFSWNTFKQDVRTATIALNEVLEEGIQLHPLQIQRDSADKWRAIGLGLFDLAGALVKLGIVYGSKEAQEFADELTHTMLIESFIQSCDLNTTNRPSDNLFDSDMYNSHIKPFLPKAYYNKYPLNSQLLTIAPTGTISTMLNAFSGGGEPAFALSYTRTTKSLHNEDVTYEVHPTLVENYMKENECSFNQLPKEFISSDKIHWKNRIDMQAALQKNIDASISSTINLDENVTVEDVYNLYMYAWKTGLKGVTIFRRNCARTAILNDKPQQSIQEETQCLDCIAPISRDTFGEVLKGTTYKHRTACGTLYITINKDENGNIVEIFTNSSKNGTCKANLNGETRMASLALRAGVKVEEVVEQLKGIHCQSCAFARAKGNKIDGVSCPDIIAKCINKAYKPQLEIKPAKEVCPECGHNLRHEGGCVTCECGWSKCN